MQKLYCFMVGSKFWGLSVANLLLPYIPMRFSHLSVVN